MTDQGAGPRLEAESFLSLLAVHGHLDELFSEHQRALVARDMDVAATRLKAFGGELRRHIGEEEKFLLPVYARAGAIPGGGQELYLREHVKLLRLLERIEEMTLLVRTEPRNRDARVVDLLDHESRFKNLLFHHDQRERNLLYPALDRVTTAAERAGLIRLCSGWEVDMAAGEPVEPGNPEFASIAFDMRDGVARIEFNRPPVNVLDIAMLREVNVALERVIAASSIKTLVLSGRGKAFSAGVEVAEHLPEKAEDMLAVFHRTFELLGAVEVPVVAAVRGAAFGGGAEVAMFCDVVICGESARFGQPEIKLAVVAPVAAALLPRLCGPRVAMEILLTGRTVEAGEAVRIGLASRVVSDDLLEREVDEIAAVFAGLSGPALRLTKRAIRRGLDRPFFEAYEAADEICLDMLLRMDDAREGLQAFLEKRKPIWHESR